jgi:hypothetical protein
MRLVVEHDYAQTRFLTFFQIYVEVKIERIWVYLEIVTPHTLRFNKHLPAGVHHRVGSCLVDDNAFMDFPERNRINLMFCHVVLLSGILFAFLQMGMFRFHGTAHLCKPLRNNHGYG